MKLAVIGYGNIAKKHIAVFRALGCHIVASCNRSDTSNALAKQEGIPVTYTNYFKMVEKEKPDAILNCVSFDNIYETTLDLIPLKIPLLIEKPAGTSLGELEALIRIQQQHDTLVQVALNRRHYSIFEKAINHIGGQDKISMISLEWSEAPIRARSIKGYSDGQISKLLYANSIHGLDTLCWFGGGLAECCIHTNVASGAFQWSMQLSGVSCKKILVNFSSSWGSPVPWRMNFYSSGERCEFAPLETCRVYSEGSAAPVALEPDEVDVNYKAGLFKQAQYFLESLTCRKNLHDLDSCLNSTQLAEALYTRLCA